MNVTNANILDVINNLTAKLNVGGAGSITFYDGTIPGGADEAIGAQNALGTLTLPATAFANAVDNTGSGRATANAITAGNASVAGTAVWFRCFDGNGLAQWDGTCGLTGSGAECILDDVTFEVNDDLTVLSWTVSHPENS